MSYLLTSESVSEGHPDKVADQISDAVLDKLLAYDPAAHVACETLVTTGLAVISGEVSTNTYVDLKTVARQTIRRIGYTKSEYQFDADGCAVINAIQEQSTDIARGVNRTDPLEQGAGDQGIIFGYATNETPDYMPLPLYLANRLLLELARLRRQPDSPMPYLRPDAKSQVTVEYDDDGTPLRIDTIVVSTQHDEFVSAAEAEGSQDKADKRMLERIRADVERVLVPAVVAGLQDEHIRRLFQGGIKYFVNPTGKFVIGGPHGDTGLTGRKIIVDTYGGKCPHGGGAFSGKDPSKVDRSAAYAARHIAKNMVAAGVADEILVQVSYAIGVARPVSIFVNTYGKSHVSMTDGEIARHVGNLFDLRPYAIERDLKLRQPIYEETAAYGHMGRQPQTIVKHFDSIYNGPKDVEVELFTWEKLDAVEKIRQEFGL